MTDETDLTATELLIKLENGIPVELVPGTAAVRGEMQLSMRTFWPDTLGPGNHGEA